MAAEIGAYVCVIGVKDSVLPFWHIVTVIIFSFHLIKQTS